MTTSHNKEVKDPFNIKGRIIFCKECGSIMDQPGKHGICKRCSRHHKIAIIGLDESYLKYKSIFSK